MGYHPTAHLAVGVKCDELFKKVSDTRTETKYNPDTGKPYEKEFKDWFLELPTGERIESGEDWGFCEHEMDVLPKQLEVFYYGDESEPVVGIELGRIETNWYKRVATKHSLGAIQAAMDRFNKICKSLGWENTPIPMVHLVLS